MGGIMKGGHGHMHASYNSSRRRWVDAYIVMVIVCLVFGCGILGLMGLHRLKERRILNILIKEKDDQILSLNHLLQKEREHMQEAKRKTEMMKMKIFSLGAQKTDLNGRVLEMQTTISSLRDEHRSVELAFQEKQNEAKLLREQYMQVKDQNPQVKALTEILRRKETEIEELNHRLRLHSDQVASQGTEEHSVIPANRTMADANKSVNGTMIDIHDEERNNPADERESSMQIDDRRGNGRLITGRSEMSSEELHRLGNSDAKSVKNGITADRSDQVRSSEIGDEKNEIETEKIGHLLNEEQNPRDEDTEAHFTDGKGLSTLVVTSSRRIPNSQRSDDQGLEVHKGLMKLEMQGNYHSGHYGFRGKRSYLKRSKSKRWRPVAKQIEGKKWSSRSYLSSTMRDHSFVEGVEEIDNKIEEGNPRNQDKIQNSIMGLSMLNESVSNNQQFKMDNEITDASHGGAMPDLKGNTEENNGENNDDNPKGIKSHIVKPDDSVGMSHKVSKFDVSTQFGNGWEGTLANSSSEDSHISIDEVPIEDTGSSNKNAANHTGEEFRLKKQEITVTKHAEDNKQESEKNDGQHNDRLGWKEVAETNEDPDDIHMEHFEESELSEDREDREQTDEPEF